MSRCLCLSAVVSCLCVVGGGFGLQAGAPGDAAEPVDDPLAGVLVDRLSGHVAPLLEAYCFACHAGERVKGGVHLEGLRTIGDVMDASLDLMMARELLDTHQMPPEGRSQPTDHERLLLVQWLDDALAYTPPDGEIDPGWFAIHRLNRSEYRNTLRDLLGIDPARHDLASGLPPDDVGYGFDNIAEVLTVSPLHLEAYLNAAERAVELALGPEVAVGTDVRPLRPLQGSASSRPLPRGGHFLFSNGAVRGVAAFPLAGTYELHVEAWGTRGGDELPRLSLRLDGREVAAHFVAAERQADAERFVARVRVEAGQREVAVHFTNDYWVKDVADRNLAIGSLGVAGPVTEDGLERPPAHGRILGPPDASGGDGRARARRVVGRFAARAFRRPLGSDELDGLMALYEGARAEQDRHEYGVRRALVAVLASPSFLYRSVAHPAPDDPSRVYQLGDHELAARLSYFLWSSMPDPELRRLADEGRLRDADVLRAQVRRLLADPKSDAFVENFAGQWLLLRNLEAQDVDAERFPEYDSALRADMITEVTLFFRDVVRADRSVLDLIDSRDVFVNERLAALYGIEGVDGPTFRRVPVPEGSPRGGVLTMGSVLTVTSNPTRTSPVKRGLYVLEQILGTPPPPPPPDIPRLEQAAEAVGRDAPLRAQLAAHLNIPSCAACHNRMDPIGLAMENFDAIGRWRDAEGGRPIDARGELPGGVVFDGPRELKRILLARDDLFVENLGGKLLTYALGRGLEPFDRPAVRSIADRARGEGDRFGALVEAVVGSAAFRSCRGRRPR